MYKPAPPDAPYRHDKRTIEGEYKDGLKTGLSWDFKKTNWVPGGPYVPLGRASFNDPDWVAYCAFRQNCHDAWMRGFRDGAYPKNRRFPFD